MSLDTPVNQVRMTNISVVHATRGGKRFEIACYRNKCMDWRDGTEKNIREVLQSEEIFENVSSGVLSKGKDLMKIFGTDDHLEVARVILAEGEFQVGDLERHQQQANLFRDIANIISTKCVNSETNLPFTETAIQNALREIHFSIHPTKSAKQQALRAIPLLKSVMKIERSKIQLRITFTRTVDTAFRQIITEKALVVLNSSDSTMDILIEPNLFREINNLVVDHGRCEVINLSVPLSTNLNQPDHQQGDDDDDDLKTAAIDRPRAVQREVVVFASHYSNCRICNESFLSQVEFRNHCKSKWHSVNQKKKIKGEDPMSLSAFGQLSVREVAAILRHDDDDDDK